MKLFLVDMIANNDDPGICYELEEYEELLDNINRYHSHITPEELKAMNHWLNEKIVFQKNWEDQHYD